MPAQDSGNLQLGVRSSAILAIVVLLITTHSLGQSSAVSPCASVNPPADCLQFAEPRAAGAAISQSHALNGPFANSSPALREYLQVEAARSAFANSSPETEEKQGFHWKRALAESFTFLAIEQAYVVHEDFRWVVSEKGIPFNHYWRDYKQSLNAWVHSGWSDGDPNLYGYLGHPIQGALTSYIQIQNDPRGEGLEFSNSKAYWRSRFKATLWNAVYSTQWNIGPLSEVTVEKYGAKVRPPWNQNGSWPCTTKHCYTGVGQIDLVMTPIGGLGWLVGEDWMDKNLARRIENATRNRFLIDTVRCTLNPVRGGANILHGNRPWYRARDSGRWGSKRDLDLENHH